MEYLDSGHPEWPQMWEALANQPLNGGNALCVNEGKCWEYLGSTIDHHNFRHELHPDTGKAEYIYIERIRAAMGWS
ncbi:4-diphosphocytidyl-2C-methyl-D-erythritol kinase [Exilibacterium tricleocarpae]|uniref:4-diphosphocytidyl-2C-methyl-D-erythritol kinase n=1 Tax=Exilibacterium tricleocarpae TaxID=2591008 RepID=A0A545U3N5_9GAMM|nr:4-diphosphocytidyl-2C-methyl-D-erythritol kinase [Exilibacterium tricleocarpae]TQV84034.1 4-diphosphocytidyl-2C-methyl-D-erythritol kinase [Exilibacterium tricleocarpae]